ncbi:MAG: Tat pathway signal sequence domain protein [Lysobacterales bacterium]|nr:MAG: Tat pathway signal sequence domain protein [Xanthomonadales bacterium]
MIRYVIAFAALFAVLATTLPLASAQSDALHIELNRLEEHGAGCRVHLVLENAGAHAYTSYRLDLVIFDADGVIARRLALETAPLRANKTMVKEFELTDLACRQVGRVLLNDVSQCASAAGDMDDCITATRVSSRGSVAFVK